MVVKKDLPYDENDLESILRYASRLTGNTMKDILGKESGLIGGTRTKGYFGQLVESDYFYIDNNSIAAPDFDKVGMELKVTPMKKQKGGLASKERLVLGIIDYNDVPKKHFHMFSDKNSHILIVFYLWSPDTDLYDYKVLKVVDWIPSEEDLRIIKEDWDVIEGYVIRGEAHLLSERHTKFLAACTKGVGHGGDLRTQPFSDVPAKQRALSFKQSYMTSLFHKSRDINEMMVDISSIKEPVGDSVFIENWEDDTKFEAYILRRFNRFVGMSCKEIEEELDIYLDDNPKQYYYTLTLAMMGILHKNRVREFEEANIKIKTIRLRKDGSSKESMSFPAFRYEELVKQTWETSDFYEQIDREFFFPVFQFNTSDPSKESRKELMFKGAFFWSVPDNDFVVIEQVWNDTKEKVLEEDFDHFVRASDGRISHIRPHAQNSMDTYPYKGREYVKRCFWFNDKYIAEIVRKNLSDSRRALDDFDDA